MKGSESESNVRRQRMCFHDDDSWMKQQGVGQDRLVMPFH